MSSRARLKGRQEGGRVAVIPHACLDSPHYLSLSLAAKALLLELTRQFNGFTNNGDLCLADKLMKPRGWAKRTVFRAADELELKGWIVKTRQGDINKPNLWALTFYPIHECKGKLDVSPTNAPLSFWKQGCNPWIQPKRKRLERRAA